MHAVLATNATQYPGAVDVLLKQRMRVVAYDPAFRRQAAALEFQRNHPAAVCLEIPDSYTLIPEAQPAKLACAIRRFVRDTPVSGLSNLKGKGGR